MKGEQIAETMKQIAKERQEQKQREMNNNEFKGYKSRRFGSNGFYRV